MQNCDSPHSLCIHEAFVKVTLCIFNLHSFILYLFYNLYLVNMHLYTSTYIHITVKALKE